MTAYKRRLQICFRGGSAAGEQQAPPHVSSSISTMADAEEREEKEKKKKEVHVSRERERERERERDRKKRERERERETERERDRKREREREREREIERKREREREIDRKKREREREREKERERERERERDRKRERERGKQKPGALVNLMWRFLFFSHQSTSRNPRSRMKTKLRLRVPPIRFDQPRQAIIPCELTRHDHCVHDCLPRRERQLVNSISDVETGLELFHSESTYRLASNRKDQVTECLFEQLLHRFKRKVGRRRHGQAQKFEAQKAQWN